MSIVVSILLMILVIGILVIAHEFGHFIVARLCKIKVFEFAIGMGSKIYKKQGKNTLFSIRAIPIGGFCSMGEDDAETDSPDAFPNHPRWQRFLVLIAGSVMNVIVGFIILLILMFTLKGRTVPVIQEFYTGQADPAIQAVYLEKLAPYGYTELPELNDIPAMLDANPDMNDDEAAWLRGYEAYMQEETGYEPFAYGDVLQVGDKFISINGKHIYSADYVSTFLGLAKNDIQNIVIERDGKRIELKDFHWEHLKSKADGSYGKRYGFTMGWEDYTFGSRVADSFNKSCEMVQLVSFSLGQMLTGQAKLNEFMGPVGLTDTINQVVSSDGVGISAKAQTMLIFAAMIAINLAVVNMLPLPALDGGRCLFIVLEAIFRRKLNAKVEAIIHTVFFVLLMLLMVLIFYGDIVRIVTR